MQRNILHFFHWMKMDRTMTEKFSSMLLLIQRLVLLCFPILKAMRNTIRLLSHLILFFRMPVRQKLPASR